jgi:signal transduction histidine kinase/ligand-binding sensor domain-containing protein
LIGIFLSTFSFGQQYLVKTYSESDGLPSSAVFSIAQDTTGMMWFATRTGLSSYDGLSFRNYSLADGLQSRNYSFIKLDEKGMLWAMPSDGYMQPINFTNGEWKNFSQILPQDNQFNQISAFDIYYENNQPVIACGTATNGLYIFQDGKWKNFKTKNGLPHDLIYDIKHGYQVLYLATPAGLATFKNGTIAEISLPELKDRKVMSIALDYTNPGNKTSRLYILTDKWFGYMENNKITILSTAFEFDAIDPGWKAFIEPDHDRGVYFGSPFFIRHYSLKTKKEISLDRKNGLISDGGTDIFFDREHNTWISGYRGISKISSRQFSAFKSENGLFSDEVASAVEMGPGKFAFGHFGAVTFLENDKFTSLVLMPDENKRNNVSRLLDMTVDPAGNLWAAVSSQGYARIGKDKKVTWFYTPSGPNTIVSSILSTPSGNLYAASMLGLHKFVNGKFVDLNLKSTESLIRKIFPGPGSTIYLITLSEGVVEYTPETERRYSCKTNKQANNVFSFYRDAHSKLWVGTLAGLYTVQDSELVKVDKNDLRIDRPVYLIIGDNEGNIWFGTDNGIYRWNGYKMDHFTVRDGLSGQEINRSAGILDSYGRMWFGTNNGLTLYQPDLEYNRNKIPAPIVGVDYVSVGKEHFHLNKERVLSNSRNNLVFNIFIRSFIDESKVTYKYTLGKNDTAWSKEIPYTTNEISFSNLEPGTYRFCIKAKNAAGIWSDPFCTSTIVIRQPLWFRWWSILLFLSVITAITLTINRVILTTRYNKRLEAMVAERTAALKDSELQLKESNAAKDRFFSIIAHDLKSPFNTLLGMLEFLTAEDDDTPPQEQKRILTNLKNSAKRTYNLLNNLLTWARAQKGIIPFNPIHLNLEELVNEATYHYHINIAKKEILLTLDIQPGLEIFADRNMIETVLRNLLSNAVKFTESGGKIHFSATKESTYVRISVEDNGMGISQQYLEKLFKVGENVVSKDTNNETGTGLGLILCKDFIERHNGTIEVMSKPAKGSTFTIKLPVASHIQS